MCEYKEDTDSAFRLIEIVLYELFSDLGKVIGSLSFTTVFWSLYFLDLRSSQEAVVMLIFVFIFF